jgi:hypothetical protein
MTKPVPANQVNLARTFNRLHKLAWHSPPSVRKKWLTVYRRWVNRHLPGNASIRYLTLYTPDPWL